MLGTVRRQIMNRTSLCYGLLQITGYLGIRTGFGNSNCCSFLVQCRLCTHPDNVVNGQFVSKYNFLVFIYIDNGRKTCKRQAKVIEKGGILTVTESIVLVIQALLVVTQKQ